MSEYAIVKDNQIINIVVAEDPMALVPFFPNCEYVERNETNGFGEPGGDYFNGYLRMKSPFPSWVWQNNQWQPPIPIPNDNNLYIWNEDTTNWVVFEDDK